MKLQYGSECKMVRIRFSYNEWNEKCPVCDLINPLNTYHIWYELDITDLVKDFDS